MRRTLLILLGLAVVALAGGFLALGAFPPRAPVQPVHETVSNDRLERANAPPVPVLPPVPIPGPAAPVQNPGPASGQAPVPVPVPVPAAPPAAAPLPAPAAPTRAAPKR